MRIKDFPSYMHSPFPSIKVESLGALTTDGVEKLSQISQPAKSILCYILLKENISDIGINIDITSCMRHCKHSAPSSFYSGICNLLEHEFLAKGVNGVYFLNSLLVSKNEIIESNDNRYMVSYVKNDVPETRNFITYGAALDYKSILDYHQKNDPTYKCEIKQL